jgi:deoxyribodipyrimidine photo-lyase
LHKVLESFNSLLKKEYGVNLIIKKGNSVDAIKEILNQTPLHGVYFNHSYTLKQIQNEALIRNEFKHLDVQSFKAKVLFEPWEIKTLKNEYFRVFTPFSKECIKKIDLIQEAFPKPLQISNNINLESVSLEELNLLPKNEGNWYENILKHWNFEHYEIERNFMDFINQKVNFYSENRNIPAKNGNANISPYLRFGMLSPKFCFQAASIMTSSYNNQFNLELLWREFAYHVAYYNHNIATQELKEEYGKFIWDNDPEFLKKWQQDKTGFDIMDARMNEL